MDIGLIVSFAGVVVATLAGVLGVWMERDPDSPRIWGFVFSAFILASSGVELVNTLDSTTEAAETDAKLATVLMAMSELAAKGNNPALEQFVGAELAVQARANPEVVKVMEKKVVAKGGDPASVTRKAAEGRRMASGLPAEKPAAGERPRLARDGGGEGRASRAGRGPEGEGARTPAERTGPAAGPQGAVGKAGKAAGQADAAVQEAGKAAGKAGKAATQAAGAVDAVTGGNTSGAVGAAAGRVQGATDAAAKTTQAATQATETAGKATDDAKKAAEDAKKKGQDKAKDAAKDAVKGFGS